MRFAAEQTLAEYAGSYALHGDAIFVVSLKNGTVWFRAPNGSERRLTAVAEDEFVIEGV